MELVPLNHARVERIFHFGRVESGFHVGPVVELLPLEGIVRLHFRGLGPQPPLLACPLYPSDAADE